MPLYKRQSEGGLLNHKLFFKSAENFLIMKAWCIWTKNKQFKGKTVYLKFNLVDMNRVKGSEVDLSFGSAVH